jgi:hypothetical protein
MGRSSSIGLGHYALAWAWLVAMYCTSFAAESCKLLLNGGPTSTVLTKRSPSDVPICLVLNDRHMFTTQVQFDVYSRIVLPGSFKAVTTAQACAIPTSVWFPAPLSCTWADGTYGEGVGFGAPTNYYVSVQGVSSNYRKRYASVVANPRPSAPTSQPTITATQVNGVFPIVTLVISVQNGIVKEVYWDDNCYFNYNRKPGTTLGIDSMDCAFNAYQMDNKFSNLRNGTYRGLLNPTGSTSTGYDTLISNAACLSNIWREPSTSASPATNQPLPEGFCDLGIYITWVGTSADGQLLASASPRFKRLRDYAMYAQYPTVSILWSDRCIAY